MNFLSHVKSKTNLVTLRICNSHLQYYKSDLSFSIKLQGINLNICKEYKTEREARGPNRSERDDWITSPKCIQICEWNARKWCAAFYILIMDEKVLVLCEKWLSIFSLNLYVLRPPESEKRVFTKVSVCLSVWLSVCL